MGVVYSVPVLLVLGAGGLREHLPDRLMKVIESRQAKTSQIEWTATWFSGEDDGMVERLITRIAGDAVWQSNTGDENGFHFTHGAVDEEGRRVPKEVLKGTQNLLIFEGRVWDQRHAERPTTARAVVLDNHYPPVLPMDFTTAGMAPRWLDYAYRTPLGLDYKDFYQGFESAAFSSRRVGHIETIVAEFGADALEWDLDHSKEGQPVRAAYYRDGRLLYESETEVTQIEDRWFPSRIWFYEGDDPRPTHVIEVQKATFNEPWHMQEIRPEDIGILFGTALFVPGAPMTNPWGDNHMRWDGTRLLSGEEYRILHMIYGIDPDPRITEALAEHYGSVEVFQKRVDYFREIMRDEYYKEHGQAPWLIQPWKERDDWDVYVEAFIKKHKFDERRTKKAKDLLQRAKQLRDYHKRNNADEIAKAQRENNHTKVKYLEEAGEKRTKQIFDMLVRSLKTLIPKDDRSPADDRDPKRPD